MKNTIINNTGEKGIQVMNTLPVPTWRWLKLNNLELKEVYIPIAAAYEKSYVLEGDLKGVSIRRMNLGNLYKEGLAEYTFVKEPFGVNTEMVEFSEKFYNAGVIIRAPKNIKLSEPIDISYTLDEKDTSLIESNLIVAEENSEITLIIDLSTKGDSEAFHNGITRIYAKDNSVVNIIKLQRMNDVSQHFDSNVTFLGYGAKINYISVELGAVNSVTNYVTNLEEDISEANLNSIYFGDGRRTIDMSYIMNHKGIRSSSRIETKGALKDYSEKVFRGTLDFKSGAKLSKGSEDENVILLDKTVKSDAVPLLLCSEDDVQGQHAASAGQIDENKLFYLMSRGLTEKEAKKLIVEASFKTIIDRIPLQNLRDIIGEEIHRRLVDG